MARQNKTQSKKIAAGGILAAGSLAILWLACVTPAARMGLTAAAGLFPMAAVLAAGRTAGYLCWAAAGLLGFFLLPDKGVVLLYLGFLGVYPVVKSRIESLRNQAIEWALKLAFFNLMLLLVWRLFQGMVFPDPPAWLAGSDVLLHGVGSIVFIVYDLGLSQLIAALQARLGYGKRR